MRSVAGAVMVVVGTLVSPAAFAGQLNALGQWVPTSSAEGRNGWTAAGPTEELASGAEVSQSRSEAAGFVRSGREIRYRIDALGRAVPAQTNHP